MPSVFQETQTHQIDLQQWKIRKSNIGGNPLTTSHSHMTFIHYIYIYTYTKTVNTP